MRPGSLRRAIGASLVSATSLLSAATPARSEDTISPDEVIGERVHLSWTRGAGAGACMDADAVRATIERRLGRSIDHPDADRSVEAIIERELATEARWRVRIYVRDRDGGSLGVRQLESTEPTCAPISEAAVLAMALAIDPDALSGPVAQPAPEVVAAPAAEPVSSCPSRPTCPNQEPVFVDRPPERVRDAARGAMLVGGGAYAGIVPGLAPGVQVEADWTPFPRVHLGTGIAFLPESSTSDGDFAFGLTAGDLRACVDFVDGGHASFAGCGAVAVGSVHGLARGLEPVDPGDRLWMSLGFGLRARLRLGGPFLGQLAATALVPLVRHEYFVIGRSESVFQIAPVGAAGTAGLGVVFP